MPVVHRKPADDRKSEIIGAARELVTIHGHKSVRMDDIAISVGISKAAIFHHFKNKHALFQAVVQDVAQEPLRAARAAVNEKADLETNLISVFIAAYTCTQYKSTKFMALVDSNQESYQEIIDQDTRDMVNLVESQLRQEEINGTLNFSPVASNPVNFAKLLLMATHGVACPNGTSVLPPAKLKQNLSILIRSLLFGITQTAELENSPQKGRGGALPH